MADIIPMARRRPQYDDLASHLKFAAIGVLGLACLALAVWQLFFYYYADVSPQKWSDHAEFSLRPDDTLTLDYSSNYAPDGGIIVHTLPFPEIKGIVTFTPAAGKAWVISQFHIETLFRSSETIDDQFQVGIPAGKTVAIVTDGKGRFFTKELP